MKRTHNNTIYSSFNMGH